MSTNKTPIHMRLYTLGFWYSRSRRNGQGRIQALRGAWRMARVKWTFGDVVISNATIGVTGTLNVGAATISTAPKNSVPIE